MSKEEEAPARVTRGALRRMSVEQEFAPAPGTPKKSTATISKKLAVLDAIKEGSNGPSDAEVEDSASRAAKGKKVVQSADNQTITKTKDPEKKSQLNRSVVAELTVENLEAFEKLQDTRRTPRRRQSQDQTLTPQTFPKRVTRRNSITSDDGNLVATTPKVTRTRHSVAAPPVIIEDDEKEEQVNDTILMTAEADLSDLDIRKLRNRSISNSPIMRVTPSSKNASMASLRDEENKSPTKESAEVSSPQKLDQVASSNDEVAESISCMEVEEQAPEEKNKVVEDNSTATESPHKLLKDVKFEESTISISNSPIIRVTPSSKNASMASLRDEENKSPTKESAEVSSPQKLDQAASSNDEVAESISCMEVEEQAPEEKNKVVEGNSTATESPHKLLKDVKFEESTPNQLNKTKYPKTPIAASGEKRRKLSEPLTTASEVIVIDETIKDSPQQNDLLTETQTSHIKSNEPPEKCTKHEKGTLSESTHSSTDTSLINIVETIRDNHSKADESISVLDTPKPKSHFTHLREGTSSTPIRTKDASSKEILEKQQEEATPTSQSWSQIVKGSGNDKGIDVFSVRKQEEEEKQEEETKKLNESLKGKSLEMKFDSTEADSDTGEENQEKEEDEVQASQNRNSFMDDEAMEVENYVSGDSMDSETRAEMENNKIEELGETIGSEDTDNEDDEDVDDNDSFIVSDADEEDELLDGSGDDLDIEIKDKHKGKKKRKRVIQSSDSSEQENEVEKSVMMDENSQGKSWEKNDSPKKLDSSKSGSSMKTWSPQKSVEANASESNPSSGKSKDQSSNQSSYSEVINEIEAANPKSLKSTPTKISDHQDTTSPESGKKSPTSVASSLEVSQSTKSPKKTPAKPLQDVDTVGPKKNSSILEADEVSDTSKPLKFLPAIALISADFYSSSAKTSKRNTINADDEDENKTVEDKTEHMPQRDKLSNLVTNPAALALAKNKKRLSQGLSPKPKNDKRASLPGSLKINKELDSPLKKTAGKSDNTDKEKVDDVDEPMEANSEQGENQKEQDVIEPSSKKPLLATKKKDVSEFNTEAVLSRCNEIIRAEKEKRKESATLRQKKKDERRRKREQQQPNETSEGATDESPEQKKKKKKKKKPVNYILEEKVETKQDQVARALQRKMAILEAKRQRKKLKKAAKLREQLNKENHKEDNLVEGIAAKLEKKVKKSKKTENEVANLGFLAPQPVVKQAISAFAVFSEQIQELKKVQSDKKKTKSKQLTEKNQQQPSAAEEVQAALKVESDTKLKKEKSAKHKQSREDNSTRDVLSLGEYSKADKNNKVSEKVRSTPGEQSIPVNQKKKLKSESVDSDGSVILKKKKLEKVKSAPLKSVVSLDDELAQLKKILTGPVTRVVKKQKLSHKESSTATALVTEVTPPRKTTEKLKALSRLETGFIEEPVTPDHKLLKRNYGFKEEPVTPKPTHFKVSSVLPAGQETLKQEATAAKKKKTLNSNRIRPEDVKEPVKGLPLPIWTKSGSFEVEELSTEKPRKSSKKAADKDGHVSLGVNGAGNSSTEFSVKPLGSKANSNAARAHRIDSATLDDAVINFKKQAIFGKNAHLREKKPKH